MSKLLKQLNDNQNKVADTNGIMKLQAWDYGVAQDLTGKKITATVANDSGFLFDLDLVSNGTEIDLDFKNERLQKLTPDTYFLEIKVTDEDGDISVFPTEGYATFTINKNLHATEGALVPQITFDTVLADVKTAMDKKVADYVKTIAKGEKGDPGPAGKDADMPVIGGRNLLVGAKNFHGEGWRFFGGDFSQSDFQGLTSLSTNKAYYGPKYNNSVLEKQGKIVSTNTQYVLSAWVNNTGSSPIDVYFFSNGGSSTSNEVIPSDYLVATIPANSGWVRIASKPFKFTKTTGLTYSIRFENGSDVQGGIFKQAGLKLESGNLATDWSPAPEDVPSNDSQLVHKTGNEVLAGDKTLPGNTTLATTTILAGNYGLRVTPSGFQKTSDGRTWVSANI